MIACACIWLAALAGEEPNLLMNPGFETVDASQPSDWSLYVKPKPGAEGRVDDQVFSEGSHAIMLRTEEAYSEDPMNNWSQNILRNLSGETLAVGGLIKTEGATGADIWLQCWRRNPWGVLYVAHTSDTHPISGTTEWTPVAMKAVIPKDTDFITVRCVLKGKGTAWFDDLRVTDTTVSANAGKDDKATPDGSAQVRENLPPAPREEAKDAKTDILREAESLADTVRSLKESNETLLKELGEVRDELKDVRDKLEKAQRASATQNPKQAAPPKKPKPVRRVPPLVPRGFDWEMLPDAS